MTWRNYLACALVSIAAWESGWYWLDKMVIAAAK